MNRNRDEDSYCLLACFILASYEVPTHGPMCEGIRGSILHLSMTISYVAQSVSTSTKNSLAPLSLDVVYGPFICGP